MISQCIVVRTVRTQSVTHAFIFTNIVAILKNSTGKLDTVSCASNLSTWQIELEGQGFKVTLSYIASSIPSWTP